MWRDWIVGRKKRKSKYEKTWDEGTYNRRETQTGRTPKDK